VVGNMRTIDLEVISNSSLYLIIFLLKQKFPHQWGSLIPGQVDRLQNQILYSK
jgi:hypothetical protein